MSKLIRRTKKNFGAALLIAANTHSDIGRLADAFLRWAAAAGHRSGQAHK